MGQRRNASRGGFSLLEVVIVVAIIAILAAIGIPRMSRGSRGANDSALSGNLSVLRNAIDLYAAEHGGTYPTLAKLKDALTLYSDASGNTNATKTTTYIYGPYVRSVPPLPVGAHKGQTGISDSGTGADTAWIYDAGLGTIKANAADDEKDDGGKAYNTY